MAQRPASSASSLARLGAAAAVLLAGLALAGLAARPGRPGVLTGRVMLGPVCPVERIPPLPQCAPRGFAATVTAAPQGSAYGALSVATDAEGRFAFTLPAGRYTLTARGGVNFYPRCAPEEADVAAGGVASATISCDTGIR